MRLSLEANRYSHSAEVNNLMSAHFSVIISVAPCERLIYSILSLEYYRTNVIYVSFAVRLWMWVCVCVLSDRFLFVLSVSLMLTESFYNKRKSSKFHLMSNNGRFSTRNHRHTEQKQKNTKKRAYSNTDVFKHSETFQDKVFAIIPRTKTETRRLSTNSHLYAIQFHSLFSFFWAVF